MIGLRSRTGIASNLSDWLDLARGLAALEVVAFHSYQLMFQEQLPAAGHDPLLAFAYSALWVVSGHGLPAVMVFFVLSGYLVGGPALVRARNGGLSAIDYFSARISRLYVVVLPALAISFCIYVFARHSGEWQAFVVSRQSLYNSEGLFFASVSPATAICNGLFLQTITCSTFAGNLALWSLSNEFWYYVLFFALISVRKTPWSALLIGAVVVLFVIAERSDPAGTHTGLKFCLYFLVWSLGVLAYAVVAPFLAWTVAFLLGLGGIYALSVKGMLPPWAAYYLTIGLVTAGVLISLEFAKVALPSFLRFTRELANFSFSLYAIHYPILVLLNVLVSSGPADFTWTSLALNVAFIVFCLVVSFIFYLSFESHTHAVRAWLSNAVRRRARLGVMQSAATVLVGRTPVADDQRSPLVERRDHSRGASRSPP